MAKPPRTDESATDCRQRLKESAQDRDTTAEGDPAAQREKHLTALLNLHTAKRRLVLVLEHRQRSGKVTDDIEAALALNGLRARALLESLRAVHRPE